MCGMENYVHSNSWVACISSFNTVNDIFDCSLLCSYGKSGSKVPQMRMYFHWSFMDYVLFQNWVPDSSGKWFINLFLLMNAVGTYAATWIAVFVFAIAFEVLKIIRIRCEKKWATVEYCVYECTFYFILSMKDTPAWARDHSLKQKPLSGQRLMSPEQYCTLLK